jgi:aryl carrier-like protein
MSAPTAERIRSDVAELLGVAPEGIDPEEDLLDRGLDSMRIMTLVERWRAGGAPALEFPDLAEEPVLSRWIEIVRGAA